MPREFQRTTVYDSLKAAFTSENGEVPFTDELCSKMWRQLAEYKYVKTLHKDEAVYDRVQNANTDILRKTFDLIDKYCGYCNDEKYSELVQECKVKKVVEEGGGDETMEMDFWCVLADVHKRYKGAFRREDMEKGRFRPFIE